MLHVRLGRRMVVAGRAGCAKRSLDGVLRVGRCQRRACQRGCRRRNVGVAPRLEHRHQGVRRNRAVRTGDVAAFAVAQHAREVHPPEVEQDLHGVAVTRVLERHDAVAAGVDPVDHFLEVVGDDRQLQRGIRREAVDAPLTKDLQFGRGPRVSLHAVRARVRNAAAAGRQTRNVADDAHQLGVARFPADHAVAAVPFEPLVAVRALRGIDDLAAGRCHPSRS